MTEAIPPNAPDPRGKSIDLHMWVDSDIATECSLLSSHVAYPREGHFECALHMMGYLKWKHNSRLFFDPIYPDIDFDTFNDGDEWKEFYGDVTKAIPPNAPEPRGNYVDLRM